VDVGRFAAGRVVNSEWNLNNTSESISSLHRPAAAGAAVDQEERGCKQSQGFTSIAAEVGHGR